LILSNQIKYLLHEDLIIFDTINSHEGPGFHKFELYIKYKKSKNSQKCNLWHNLHLVGMLRFLANTFKIWGEQMKERNTRILQCS